MDALDPSTLSLVVTGASALAGSLFSAVGVAARLSALERSVGELRDELRAHVVGTTRQAPPSDPQPSSSIQTALAAK